MTLLDFTLKNLLRRPIRTVLTVMGIGVGIGAVVALLGLARGLSESWNDAYKARGTDLVVRKGADPAGRRRETMRSRTGCADTDRRSRRRIGCRANWPRTCRAA